MEELSAQNMPDLKHKILSVLMPPDLEKLKLLRHEMTLDPRNNKIKNEFETLLMRSSTCGLMQVKEYSVEERKVVVWTTSLEPPQS